MIVAIVVIVLGYAAILGSAWKIRQMGVELTTRAEHYMKAADDMIAAAEAHYELVVQHADEEVLQQSIGRLRRIAQAPFN